jgi:hypothetical protein
MQATIKMLLEVVFFMVHNKAIQQGSIGQISQLEVGVSRQQSGVGYV